MKPLILVQLGTLAGLGVREALHSKLLWLCFFATLGLLAAAGFAAGIVVVGGEALRAGMLAWGLRWLGVLTMTLFCVSSTVREGHGKLSEMLLVLSVRREVLCAGRLCGFSAIIVCFSAMAFLACSAFAPLSIAAQWSFSLALELLIVSSFALWVAAASNNVVLATLMTLGFYLLSRTMEALVAMADKRWLVADAIHEYALVGGIKVVSWLLPRLYNYASADWLIESAVSANLLMQLLLSAIYTTMLSSFALLELYRRQF